MAVGGVLQGELEDPPWTESWICLVDIFQHRWRTGEILKELGWNFLVLVPKGTTDTWGIGLLDTLCKVE